MRNFFLFVVFLLNLGITSNAQIFEPVKWEFKSEQVGTDEFNLIFTAKIDDGWAVYSQFLEEGGPVATEFVYDDGSHFAKNGTTKESGNLIKGFDKVFEMDVAKFKKKGVFTQTVKISDYSKPVTGYLTYMTCNDERCLPPTDVDFSFQLSPSSGAADKPKAENKAPEKQPEKVAEKPKSNQDNKAATTSTNAAKSTNAEPMDEAVTATEPTADEAEEEKSGILEPVEWSFETKKISDTEFDLIATATMEEGWNIYSQATEEGGPVPTAFYFDEGAYEAVGEVVEVGKKKEGPDPLFDGVNVIKFVKSPVTFTQRVKTKDASQPIKGYLEFMTCDDKQCLPPTEVDFTYQLSNEGSTPTINAANIPEGTKGIDQKIPSIRATFEKPLGDCGEFQNRTSHWQTFIFGFLGGLIALLTPCVFPMIPLTVSYFTKSSTDRASGIKNALIYGLSIIVIYVSIGLAITAIAGPTALQDLSTNWIANVLFFLIFIFFAFSFFGYYEITLPSSWSNKSDSMADKGGLIGTFFMAFTLALVSFSCTGPIIGSLLVEAADTTIGPAIGMLGFSTALALPFALFAAFPGWLNSLPRSGGWMTSVKVVLGFLELAFALKFLSVADMTMHWGILPYEIFLGLWVIISALTTIYLLGYIRFPHDSPLKKLSPSRMAFAALFGVFTLYLLSGFMYNDQTKAYNSPSILSGILPPPNYNLFLEKPQADADIKSKYPSFTKCANNLDCFKDYYEGMAYAKETDLPVLLDFTGHGCVNCRKTEDKIWSKPAIRDIIDQQYILISLYTDDRKNLDEMLYSVHRETRLRNIGHRWQDFQIINFDQNSQPLYVLMTPEEQVMAVPRGYQESSSDYQVFLECGLDTYKKYKAGKLGMK